jgi:hypothetical protein
MTFKLELEALKALRGRTEALASATEDRLAIPPSDGELVSQADLTAFKQEREALAQALATAEKGAEHQPGTVLVRVGDALAPAAQGDALAPAAQGDAPPAP